MPKSGALDTVSMPGSPAGRLNVAAEEAREFESRADLVLIVDPEARLAYASASWSSFSTSPRACVPGRPLLEAICDLRLSRDEQGTLMRTLGAAMRDEGTAPIELNVLDPVLGRRYLEGRAYGPRHPSGNLVVVFHERTLAMLEAVQLTEDVQRLRMIAEASQDMVTETDSKGVFTYVSPACSLVLGYSEAQLLGHAPLDLHHPDDLPGFLEQISRIFDPGKPFYVGPHRLRRADDRWIWVEATGVRYERPDGEIRIVGVARDITARREAESARRQLEEQVRRAQKLESLGILAGGIAHDFNNFLTPIVGTAGLLAEDLADDPERHRLVETIRKAARRATDLTSQMLTYAGKNEPRLERLDISESIEDMALLLESVATQTARLEYALETSLPPVRADRAQIGQVVMNLVSNAAEALGQRNGTICLSTGLLDATRDTLAGYHLGAQRAPGRFVYVEVQDDGGGIDAETREQIFDPFFSTKFTGRGLGLAVVLGIVKRHSGALRIDSAEGEGTRFRIILPVAEGIASESNRTGDTQDTKRDTGATGLLLVVDDDEGAREVACLMLERAGFEVKCAVDGEQAIELFQAFADRIRGVVLDHTMPGISGAQVLDALRGIDPDVPVVLISGYTRERIADNVLGRRGVCFVSKPFDEQVLVAAMTQLINAVGGR